MLARVINLVVLTAVLIALPLSHVALSMKKAPTKKAPVKVAICHFPDDSDVGNVIKVSASAVAAHVAKHGDCTSFATDIATGNCSCFVIGPGG